MRKRVVVILCDADGSYQAHHSDFGQCMEMVQVLAEAPVAEVVAMVNLVGREGVKKTLAEVRAMVRSPRQ